MKVEHLVADREAGCPFGHKCDTCNLYQPLYKTEDNGNVTQQYNCMVNNIAVLLHEMKVGVTGVQAATESFRNEMVKDNDEMRRVMAGNSVRLVSNDS